MNVELKPNGKVHPVAEMFPLMTDEELDDLAASIKATGLLTPIVLDDDGTLIDGRNRVEACKRAKVEPCYEALEGRDPLEVIFGSNATRRHMTKGQLAMVAVKAEAGRRLLNRQHISARNLAKLANVNDATINQAWLVHEYANELVDQIIRGSPSLTEAVEDARRAKAAVTSREAQLVKLEKAAPDLADQVKEERLKLVEALAAYDAREEEQRRERKRATEMLRDIVLILDNRGSKPADHAQAFVENFDPKFSLEEISKDRLKRCLEVLKEITTKWRDGDAIEKRVRAGNDSGIRANH
jgi:hypothetical protein